MIKITSHASEVSLVMHLPVVYTFYWSFKSAFSFPNHRRHIIEKIVDTNISNLGMSGIISSVSSG